MGSSIRAWTPSRDKTPKQKWFYIFYTHVNIYLNLCRDWFLRNVDILLSYVGNYNCYWYMCSMVWSGTEKVLPNHYTTSPSFFPHSFPWGSQSLGRRACDVDIPFIIEHSTDTPLSSTMMTQTINRKSCLEQKKWI